MSRKTYTLTLTAAQWRELKLALHCYAFEDLAPERVLINIWNKIDEAEA